MRAALPGPSVRTTDDVSLATWDLGGSGAPLLFLHPTGFHARCWAPHSEELRERFHCWALDQRGHGASGRASDYAWRRFSDDVMATLAVLDLERPFVVGHSLGGAVALMTEALHPGTFRAIYGFEPIVFVPRAKRMAATGTDPGDTDNGAGLANASLMARLARRRRSHFASRAAALDNYARKPPFAHFRADALAAYVDGGFVETEGGVTLSCDTESEALVFEAARLSGIGALLQPSSTPTHLACGGEDPVVGPEQLDDIARMLGGHRDSRVSTEVFADLSHLGPFEDPKRVARAIDQAFVQY